MLKQHGWISSGEIQRICAKYSTHTPRSCVRRLQEMYEDGILERQLRGNHAWYKIKDGTKAPAPKDNFIPGLGHLPSYEELHTKGVV